MPRDLHTLPKAHLHLHLEGSARRSTAEEIVERGGNRLVAPDEISGWAEFLGGYVSLMLALTVDDVPRLCRELLEDEASQGVTYTQPHVSPSVYALRFDMSMADALALLHDAFTSASAATGVAYGLVVNTDRVIDVARADEIASVAAEHAGQGVTALGLAGDESIGPCEPFARAAAIAHDAGLLVVPHAGELAGPESVWAALEHLDADRIAHGIRAAEDPSLMKRLAGDGVACDVCPTSNVKLGVVGEMGSHPLPRLLDAGVPVTINTDDQLFFGPLLAAEYANVRDAFGLSDDELAGVARTSAEVSGAPADVVAAMHAGIDAWLAS